MRCKIVSRNSLSFGIPAKDNRTGRLVDAVIVSTNPPSLLTQPINSAAERPTGVSEIWRNAGPPLKAETGTWTCRNRSPGASALRWSPVTKSTTGIFRSPPPACQIVQTPSSAEAREIVGPAGSDMQMLPPTVAVFQILKEARNARQHWLISGEAIHSGGQESASSCATVQVADIDNSVSPMVSAGHFRSVRSIRRVNCACGHYNE